MSEFQMLVEGWFSKKVTKEPKLSTTNAVNDPLNFNFDMKKSTANDKFFEQHLPLITLPEHKKALDIYTKESKELNNHLWNRGISNPSQNRVIDNLTATLKTAKPAQDDFHLYSGVNIDPQTVKPAGIHIPAYTSASTDHRIAGLFARKSTTENATTENGNLHPISVHHVLKINVKKGQHIGSYIAPHSSREFEREFLINKNHTFHVTGNYEDHIQPAGIFSKPKIFRIHEVTIHTHE